MIKVMNYCGNNSIIKLKCRIVVGDAIVTCYQIAYLVVIVYLSCNMNCFGVN